MITKEKIVEFFKDIDNCQSFDFNKELTWGYFFLSANKNQLEKTCKQLITLGYIFVDIFDAEKDNIDDDDEFYLHVEKKEKHNVDSLFKRNEELYAIAFNYKIEYDGFDVGN
jgi:ribosomal protein L11 methylase PrmA